MSVNFLRVVIAGGLLLHGIAHAVALMALLRQALTGTPIAKPAVRTWVSPGQSPRIAAILAIPFWALGTVCFLAGSATFWGILSRPEWRQLAVPGATVATLGIALFPSPWPGSESTRRSLLNTSIALAVNVVILATQLWLHWPPVAMFGK
jgi:hypothetical protein